MNETFEEFIDLLGVMGSFLLQLWHELPTVAIAVIVGVIAGIALVVAVWRIANRKRRQSTQQRKPAASTKGSRCQHHECGRQWTTRVNSEGHPGCVPDGPCCDSCHKRHESDMWQRRYHNGDKPLCIRDGAKLSIEKRSGFVAYRCPKCNARWIDGCEFPN